MSEETTKNEETLQELLKKNLALSEEMAESVKKIRSYMKWQNFWATVRLLIILIPIAIGFLYLPPLIKGYLAMLKQ